jgi:chromosome segregation ATPase
LELKETKQLATRVTEAESEKERFENLYETGKRKENDFKKEIIEFRSDLLKVKHDKNDICKKLKASENEVSRLEEEIHVLKNENKARKDDKNKIDRFIKSKEEEIQKLS